MMVKVIIDISNLETKITIQVLCNKITGVKSTDFSYNIPKLLDYILSIIDLITELSKTHNTLLNNTFNILLGIPNSYFYQFFELEKLK